MNAPPRTVRPMEGDKLDPLSRPPVIIPSFSKLPAAALGEGRVGRPPKEKPVSEFDYIIAALKAKRDKLSAAIAALEALG